MGTATGVLMAHYGTSWAKILHMLRAAAQDNHRSMTESASEIIDAETRRPCAKQQFFLR